MHMHRAVPKVISAVATLHLASRVDNDIISQSVGETLTVDLSPGFNLIPFRSTLTWFTTLRRWTLIWFNVIFEVLLSVPVTMFGLLGFAMEHNFSRVHSSHIPGHGHFMCMHMGMDMHMDMDMDIYMDMDTDMDMDKYTECICRVGNFSQVVRLGM